jgi:hypothetical protein
VPAAERSEEAAVENQQDILFALKIGQAYFVSVEIRQREIWGGLIHFDSTHSISFSFLTQNPRL